MTDSLSVQPQIQKKDNTVPYALGGAAVGALGGYGVAHYTTKPKYESFEDLVKEKQDDFEKSVKEASDDMKSVYEDAKSAREAGEKAGKEWESKWAAAKEANKNGIVPDENYAKLEKDLADAKNAVETKRTELINKEIEVLKKNNTTAPSGKTSIYGALEDSAKNLSKASDVAERKQYAQKAEELAKNIAEKMEYAGTEAEIKAAKEKVANTYSQYIQELAQYNEYNNAKSGLPKNVKDYLTALKNRSTTAETAKAEIKKSFLIMKDLTGQNIENIYDSNPLNAKYTIKRHADLEKKHLKTLKELENKLEGLVANGKQLSLKERIAAAVQVVFDGKLPSTKDPQAELQKYINGLEKSQKAQFEKIINGDITIDSVKNAIKNSENKLNSLKQAWNNIDIQKGKIENAKKELVDALNDVQKDFKGKIRITEDGKVYENGKLVKHKNTLKGVGVKPQLQLPKGVNIPEGLQIEYGNNVIQYTEEQLKQKATEAVKDSALKAELDAQKLAQNALDNAKKELPKVEVKSEEQLLKEFIEKHGDKEKVIKEAGEQYKEKLKALFEKKISNKKLAAYLAGGAAIVGTLGYMMAPKNKEV